MSGIVKNALLQCCCCSVVNRQEEMVNTVVVVVHSVYEYNSVVQSRASVHCVVNSTHKHAASKFMARTNSIRRTFCNDANIRDTMMTFVWQIEYTMTSLWCEI